METDRTRDTRKNGSVLGLALSASSAHTTRGTEDEEATAGSGSGSKASPRAWRRAWTAWGGSKKQAKDSPVPANEKQTNDSGGSGSQGVAVCAAFHAERSAAQLPVPEGEREF